MKQLKINIPKGYEVDKEKSNLETREITFRLIEDKTLKMLKGHMGPVFYIDALSSIVEFIPDAPESWIDSNEYMNILPDRQTAQNMLVLCRLLFLRHYFMLERGENPEVYTHSHAISKNSNNEIYIVITSTSHILSFEKDSSAKEFFSRYKDLIEKAVNLI